MAALLLTAVFLPLAVALLPFRSREAARLAALVVTLAVFALTVNLVVRFPGGADPVGIVEWSWLGWADIAGNTPFLALDGLSLWLFALTALLMILAVLIGWNAVAEQAVLYYRLLLILETGMLGVFAARDILLFYVFFEFTLIPLFFLIGIWGGPQRRYAAAKFFLFTLTGSVLTFLGLLAIVIWNYYASSGDSTMRILTFSISDLSESLRTAALRGEGMGLALQIAVFIALFAGFAIKVPLFPLHTWLPLAHVEAPTAGSVLLAGVLLKIGVYGFLRFNLPMLPQAAALLMPWLLWIALAGILYGAMVALAQRDIKRLIAYSSVSHMGFCMLGVFALNPLSLQGGALQMVNHGLATGGLFAVVGMIYERYHTRKIDDLGGLAKRMPILAFFAMVLTLSSIALPGLGGFVGEFLILLGAFQRGWTEAVGPPSLQLRAIAVLAVGGVVLGAWYMLWMYQRVFFGPLREPKNTHAPPQQNHPAADARDLSPREILCLAPLAIIVLWIGLYPQFFLARMAPSINDLANPAIQAFDQQTENRKLRERRAVIEDRITRETKATRESTVFAGKQAADSSTTDPYPRKYP